METIEQYATEHQINVLELFLIGHNFHKDIVYRVSRLLEMTDQFPRDKTFREADLTFRNAMREFRESYLSNRMP